MTRVLSGRSRCRWAALVSLIVFLFPLASHAQDVATVGEMEPYSLESGHPYGVGAAPQIWTVHYPGATYIRLHFRAFDLSPGDRLEVTRPDGSELNTYTLLGPHRTGEFWALSVDGDTAVLALHSVSGQAYGFEIDGFGRGIRPLHPDPLEPKTVCGPKDWKDVACYSTSNPSEVASSHAAVLVLSGCCVTCSGFKVSDSGQFMTNNHCISTQTGVETAELRFDYERPGCASGRAEATGSVLGGTLLLTDTLLDYTLFNTIGDSSIIPCLELENRLPTLNERIYIPGHPSGGPKTLAFASTHPQNPAGLCEVDASPFAGGDADSDIGYYCDTSDGSSGSPVVSGLTHKVVAIHHYGGCLNSGARMDRILPQLTGVLEICSAGDPHWCGDQTCDEDESPCSCAVDCGVPPSNEIPNDTCGDTVDNDCDQLIDCGDADCVGDTSCPTCLPVGAACLARTDCCSNRCKGQGANRTCRP